MITRAQSGAREAGYRCWAMRPKISSVGVEKFDDRLAAATIWAPLSRS
jgi:hypothetical protein